MSKNIYSSIEKFSKEIVDLNPIDLKNAKNSRKWLVDKIEDFPLNDDKFPKIYNKENDVQMGSFRRHTKIRPIDDIDFIIVFSAEGTTYQRKSFSSESYELFVPDEAERLKLYTNQNLTLNSIKVINILKKSLSSVPHYEKAEIQRNQEAVTLNLKSYDWNFDIVPAFITSSESNGRSYYLIPDGEGNWKKTDPRIDSIRTTEINKKRDGKVLKYIRLIKYWNRRATMPTISSYLLENLVLDYFDKHEVSATDQSTLRDLFDYLSTAIYSNCEDPKGIQGNLNNLDIETKNKISTIASISKSNADNAIDYTISDDHHSAHSLWRKIFGEGFPIYG